MVGTGNLAPHLVAAHATVRDIDQVLIWGRRAEAAHKLAASLEASEADIRVFTDLEAAVRHADIISCATLASTSLIRGAWLHSGQHLDLVGSFTPGMREADNAAIQRSRVFVDTYTGALAESGETISANRLIGCGSSWGSYSVLSRRATWLLSASREIVNKTRWVRATE